MNGHISDTVVTVREFRQDDASRWDAFVRSSSRTTFFHLSGWKEVIERAFGHSTHFLLAETQGSIIGVLPLARVKSILFSDALVSLPFCVYGGIAAESDMARAALCSKAMELARDLRVDYLETRNRAPTNTGWPTKDLYVTFRRILDPDPEENMRAVPRKQRAMIRKGIKAGLKSEVEDGVGRFFRAYSESVRNLGTPVFSRKYFELLCDVFSDACEIMTVTESGRVISSVMSFYFKDEVLPYYGGGTKEARPLKANDFMYWELMRRACERGIRVFDYGRSKKGTGSYSFKKNWGFDPQPLSYEYFLVRSDQVPDVNPLNPKYRFFINAWKRLPLPVANRIGPMLAKSLG